MTVRSTFFRWLLKSMGAVGLVLCLASTIGVWYGVSLLNQAVGTLFQEATQAVEDVRVRAAELRPPVVKAERTFSETAERLEDWQLFSDEQKADLRRSIESVTEELGERCHAIEERLIEVQRRKLEPAVRYIAVTRDLIGHREIVKSSQVHDRLMTVSTELKSKLRDVTQLQQTVGESDWTERGVGAIGNRLEDASGLLDAVDTLLEEFDQKAGVIDHLSKRLSGQLFWWSRLVGCIITFVLIWIVFGQYALIRTAAPQS